VRFPDAAAATALPLHVLVRDFPETLGVLRNAGVAVPAAGGQPLGAGGAPSPVHELIAAMATATAWRGAAPPGPCDQAAELAAVHAAVAARERAEAAARD